MAQNVRKGVTETDEREYYIHKQIFHEFAVSEVMTTKERAQMIFAHKKLSILEIYQTMVNLTEVEIIKALKTIIRIDEIVTNQFVHAAKQWRSLRESEISFIFEASKEFY
jgi:hypothetical protein